MTETTSNSGEAVLTVVCEGPTSKGAYGRVVVDVEKHARALSARDESSVQQGSMLSRDLLSQVDLTPKATEPQDSWGWEIAGYLYLGGLGAGAFIVAVLLDWIGLQLPSASLAVVGGWDWNWAAIFVYWGPAITALGAFLLIFHLGRNWFLLFTACLNPRSSWLARGFLILATFIIVGGLAAVAAVFFPEWPHTLPAVWRAIQAIGFVFACGTAIYTGILLRSMKYIPAWNSLLLPALFFASALSTGAMGIALGTLLFRLISRDAAPAQSVVERIETADPAIIVAEGVLLVLYLRHLAKGKPEARLSVTMLLSGTWRYPFWVGVVGGALVLPLLLGGISLILPLTNLTSFRLFGVDFEVASILVLAAAVTVLCGGFLLRLGVLGVGIKERPPLYGLSKWRAEHGMPLVAIDVDDPSGG